jgi:hypothetical protein
MKTTKLDCPEKISLRQEIRNRMKELEKLIYGEPSLYKSVEVGIQRIDETLSRAKLVLPSVDVSDLEPDISFLKKLSWQKETDKRIVELEKIKKGEKSIYPSYDVAIADVQRAIDALHDTGYDVAIYKEYIEEDLTYHPGSYLVHANCTRCGWSSATYAFYSYIDPEDEFSPDEEQIQEAIGKAEKVLQKLHDEVSDCNSVISCY